jgi:hypothetical protein
MEGRPKEVSVAWGFRAPRLPLGLASILGVATLLYLLAYVLHHPYAYPPLYSDWVSFWGRGPVRSGLIPYLDYDFEYPALTGLLVYVASKAGSLPGYFNTLALMTYLAVVATLIVLYRLLELRGLSPLYLYLYCLFTPTYIYYSIHSFDWVGIGLAVAAIYLLFRGRSRASGFMLGLAVAARIIPVLLAPIMLQRLRRGERANWLVWAFFGWLLPNLPFLVGNLEGFLYPYRYQAGWIVENSWLLYLPAYRKEFSAVLMGLLALLVYRAKRLEVYDRFLAILLAFTIASYKFPPQYLVLLLPFFTLRPANYFLFLAANVLNVAIKVWWFSPILTLGDPLDPSSPMQWISTARQALLALLLGEVLRPGVLRASLWARVRRFLPQLGAVD